MGWTRSYGSPVPCKSSPPSLFVSDYNDLYAVKMDFKLN